MAARQTKGLARELVGIPVTVLGQPTKFELLEAGHQFPHFIEMHREASSLTTSQIRHDAHHEIAVGEDPQATYATFESKFEQMLQGEDFGFVVATGPARRPGNLVT